MSDIRNRLNKDVIVYIVLPVAYLICYIIFGPGWHNLSTWRNKCYLKSRVMYNDSESTVIERLGPPTKVIHTPEEMGGNRPWGKKVKEVLLYRKGNAELDAVIDKGGKVCFIMTGSRGY